MELAGHGSVLDQVLSKFQSSNKNDTGFSILDFETSSIQYPSNFVRRYEAMYLLLNLNFSESEIQNFLQF